MTTEKEFDDEHVRQPAEKDDRDNTAADQSRPRKRGIIELLFGGKDE